MSLPRSLLVLPLLLVSVLACSNGDGDEDVAILGELIERVANE